MRASSRIKLITSAVTLVFGIGCMAADRDPSPTAAAAPSAPVSEKAEYRDQSLARTIGQGAAGADAVQRVRDQRDSVAPGMIIRNGSAIVEVATLDSAIAALRALAQRLGGYVANTSVTTGRDQVPSGTIELKIPAARYDSALAGLEPLGKVESVNTTAEDVGEEFVDVTARLANARRLEDRIVAILATRAGKLEDVIAAERELARVREEIERYEGRLRFLRTRAALSTLTVTVHETYPVVGAPGTGPIALSVKQMWRNFVLFAAGLISSLGWLLPVSAIGYLVWVAVRRYQRKRQAVVPLTT